MNTSSATLAITLAFAAAVSLQAQTVPDQTTPSAKTAPAGATSRPAPTPAQVNGPAPSATADEVIQMNPFEVSTTRDMGYEATETLAGTRIRTNLADVAASISVVNKQFLEDIGATDALTLLQYTTNAQVAGTEGTYAGVGNAQSVNEQNNLINPSSSQRVRGLASADNTRDYYITDIPWDSYNVDRIDILRGPNSFLFGLGSPAGIVNASLRNAEFRNGGDFSFRGGSYGSTRGTIDINQQLLPDVLAVRVASMYDDRKYEQKEAFQNQKRIYGALRFDPDLFKRSSLDLHTSIKAKIESGDISADHPRILPPSDNLTAWWRPNAVTADNPFGGMGKAIVNNYYDPWRTDGIVAGTDLGMLRQGTANYSPYLADAIANVQEPYWLFNGSTGQLYGVDGNYVNIGALTSTGASAGAGNGLPGRVNSSNLAVVGGLVGAATNYKAPGVQYGQYRTQSLEDSSIFNFYDNLLDGPTASQYEKWTAYNIDFTETALGDRLGLDVTYDRQNYGRGGQALLGWGPAITMDIMQNPADYYLSGADGETSITNPNFGRPLVTGAGGNGGSSYRSTRQYWRGSLYGELRASDFLHNDFLTKLLGTHRFNLVASNEQYFDENLAWQMYANSQAWAGYWIGSTGNQDGFNDRPPEAVIYLGPSIIGRASASGANIPGITTPIYLQSHGVYVFDSTWTATGVPYGAPWSVPSNLFPVFEGYPNPAPGSTQLYQNSNPANYKGWNSGFTDNITFDNMGTDPTLLTTAEQSFRETISYAGTYQAYLWNNAIIPTLGWRYDEVETKDVTAHQEALNRGELDTSPQNWTLPNSFPINQIFKNHSTSGGVVVHLNNLLPHDFLPFEISGSYNDSNNFQVTSVRRDVYGNSIPNPVGKTKEYGLLLSTKDDRFSLRIVKYDTTVSNGTSTLGRPDLIGSTIADGLKWRNIFLYQLGGYTMDTVGQSSYRWTYTSIFPSLSATQAQANLDSAITGWNNIQKYLEKTGFFQAWNFTPTGPDSVLVDRTTYAANPSAYQPSLATVYNYGATQPQGFTVTSDTESKGYEFDFTANPLHNLRVEFNAAKTEAIENNVGGQALSALISYLTSQLYNSDGSPTPAGNLPRYGNTAFAIDTSDFGPFLQNYTLLKLQEGSDVSELRKWQFNLVGNYSFDRGWIKGFGVGGAYRWQDKVVIGYPVLPVPPIGKFDLSHPFYGPSQDGIDLWASYERRVTKDIGWKIQLNVTNAFARNGLIPVSVEPNGQWAAVRIKPTQEWFVTNTFTF